MAENPEQRGRALAKILPMQRKDFVGILKEMAGLPVDETSARSAAARISAARGSGDSRSRQQNWHDHRTPKTGAAEPVREQSDAGASRVAARNQLPRDLQGTGARNSGSGVRVAQARRQGRCRRSWLPLIGERKEFDILAGEIREVAAEVFKEYGVKVPFTIGTMIEVPRACVTADQIGEVAEFFSFGTNDLTQMTYGISRDDSGKFLDDYVNRGIYKKDPFQELDPVGRRRFDANGDRARAQSNKKLKIGICGEGLLSRARKQAVSPFQYPASPTLSQVLRGAAPAEGFRRPYQTLVSSQSLTLAFIDEICRYSWLQRAINQGWILKLLSP